jgi:type II secretory pathway pseudopilin PulG
MRGQSKIISVLLIVMIVLAAIALVLPWTFSMIQKKQDMKSLDDVYNFFQTLDETIRNIAKSGGEESLRLNVPGVLQVFPESFPSELKNSIVFNMSSKVSYVAQGAWIPLNTPNMNETATLGVDPPSVIFARAERKGDEIHIQYRLWYRTLNDTQGNLYKIVLNTSDDTPKSTTSGFLRIQNIGSERIESLTITKINIIV